MRLKKLTITNFLSYGPTQVVDLYKQGLVGVFGNNLNSAFDSNGSGKSGALEAIVWCLWGETIRGLKSDEVINDSAGKNCEVGLELEDGDQTYLVTRYRGKEGVKKKNDVLLSANGVDVTHGTVTDTQAMINSVVGINFDTFSQSVLLTSNTQSFCTLKDSEQKEVLEDILDIDILRRAHAEVKSEVSELRTELAGHLGKLEPIAKYITGVEEDIVALEAKSTTFDREKGLRSARAKQSLADAHKSLKGAEEAKESCVALEDSLEALEDSENAALAEISDLTVAIEEVGDKVAVSLHKLSMKKAEHNALISMNEDAISRLASMAGTTCTTCNQLIDVDAAEAQMDDLEERRSAANDAVVHLVMLEARLGAAADEERAPFLSALGPLKDKLKLIHGKASELGVALREAQNSAASLEAFSARCNDLEDRIKQDQDDRNPYTDLIASGREDITTLKKDSKRLKIKIKGIENKIIGLAFWEVGFGNRGLKSYIMDNVVPFLNERAQKYADIMSGGALTIRFSTQTRLKGGGLREKFSVAVTNSSGSNVYKGNSGGERRRSDVAIGWALADLAATRSSKPIKFRGLDEPFENLDAEGIDSVFRLLQNAVGEYETVLCITHNTDLKNRFNKELVVQKRKFSSIMGK